MGYKIQYIQSSKSTVKKGNLFRRIWLSVQFLFIFLILVNYQWPEGAQIIQTAFAHTKSFFTVPSLEVFATEMCEERSLHTVLLSFLRKMAGMES